MAKVNLKVSEDLAEQTRDRLSRTIRQRGRDNFADFRPVIATAINRAVSDTQNQFIPTDDQAAELGVGEKRRIDREKTNNAWKQLEVDKGATTFSIRAKQGNSGLATVTISIDTEAFFKAPLSIVELENTTLPWIKWLIKGATVDGYTFSDDRPVPKLSRTGRGIMVEGGLWRFSPANPNAFKNLEENLRRRVENSIRRNIGSVIK